MRLLFELGKAYRALQDYAEALEAFEEGMSLAEAGGYECLSNAHALNAVIALARSGRPAEAEERLRAACGEGAEEHQIAAWRTLARAEVSWAAGRCGEAKRLYEAAVERFAGTPAEADARVLLAQRLWEEGQTKRAGKASR